MKVVRSGVFETNSSSSHSLSIGKRGSLSPFRMPVNNDGYVEVDFGDFGWGYEKLESQLEKLSYLLTMVAMTETRFKVDHADVDIFELFAQTDGFQKLNAFVCKYCEGIALENISLEIRQSVDEAFHYIDYDGYIDHQSCENYGSLEDFLNNYGLSIDEIILNDDISIIIDNDNGC